MKDINDCAAELIGLSMVLTGLSNQLDNSKTDTLNSDSLGMALFAIAKHLDRIADDLGGAAV